MVPLFAGDGRTHSRLPSTLFAYSCFYSFILFFIHSFHSFQAHLSRESDSASYHLNRSLLEARKYKQFVQEENTLEVMRRLGVDVIGLEKAKTAPPVGPDIV